MRNLLNLLFSLFILCGLAACGSSVPMLKPYKMDIQQGNVVTSKMLLQLKPGMTKSQVRYIMGTPLIVDSFHNNRWDYFYQMRQAGKIIEQRRVILEFEKDLLARVHGDVVPQGTPGAVSGEPPVSKTTAESAKKADDKGWLDKLKFWKGDEKAPAVKPLETKPMEVPKAVTPEMGVPESVNPEVAPAGEEAPSILAVPIGGAAASELPKVDMPAVETPKIEAPKVTPAKVEPVPESAMSAPLPVKAEPAKGKPVQVPSGKQDDKKIFRMDRSLDLKHIEEEAAPEPVAEPVAEPASDKPVPKKKKKVDDAPLPPETEPSFFDRMLEKIGF